MEQADIEEKMKEFAKILNYEFNDIEWLKKAMCAQKIENTKDDYTNDSLAIVGDAFLKFIITDVSFKYDNKITKGEIDAIKQKLERNKTMSKIMNQENWKYYAYNDKRFYNESNPKHEQVVNKEHTPYVEAIIAAIYYDLGFDNTYNWVKDTLYPLLNKYSPSNDLNEDGKN